MTENAADKIRNAVEDLVRDRKSLVKILSIAVILLLALILRIHGANKSDITVETAGAGDAVAAEEADTSGEEDGPSSYSNVIFIDLGGAVMNPGVYKVSPDTRLYMVIEMAGGLTEDADTNSVNQASFVQDGEKIIIPSKNDPNTAALPDQVSTAAADASGLININIASKDELMTLNGVGEVIAERIIEYRTSNRFRNKEDIMSVKGIGSGIYEKIKDSIVC